MPSFQGVLELPPADDDPWRTAIRERNWRGLDDAGSKIGPMVKRDHLLWRILAGRSDANIRFDELCSLLRSLGFEERTRGSHHLFVMAGIEDLINLQREGSKAKPYQVRQVRKTLVRYGLGSEE